MSKNLLVNGQLYQQNTLRIVTAHRFHHVIEKKKWREIPVNTKHYLDD